MNAYIGHMQDQLPCLLIKKAFLAPGETELNFTPSVPYSLRIQEALCVSAIGLSPPSPVFSYSPRLSYFFFSFI
jgi:hypothetical protein